MNGVFDATGAVRCALYGSRAIYVGGVTGGWYLCYTGCRRGMPGTGLWGGVCCRRRTTQAGNSGHRRTRNYQRLDDMRVAICALHGLGTQGGYALRAATRGWVRRFQHYATQAVNVGCPRVATIDSGMWARIQHITCCEYARWPCEGA